MTDAHRFSLPAIDLMPPSIRVPLEVLWQAAAWALTVCLARFGAPEIARRTPWLSVARPLRQMLMLRRAQKILRCVMFICARYFGLTAAFAPSRKRAFRRSAPRMLDENDPATWSVAFLMPPRLRPLVRATNAPQPLHFQTQNQNPMRVLARRMEGLRRVLAAHAARQAHCPRAHARRLPRRPTAATSQAARGPPRSLGRTRGRAPPPLVDVQPRQSPLRFKLGASLRQRANSRKSKGFCGRARTPPFLNVPPC